MKSNSEDKEIELSLKIKDTPEIFVDTIHNVRLVKNPKRGSESVGPVLWMMGP